MSPSSSGLQNFNFNIQSSSLYLNVKKKLNHRQIKTLLKRHFTTMSMAKRLLSIIKISPNNFSILFYFSLVLLNLFVPYCESLTIRAIQSNNYGISLNLKNETLTLLHYVKIKIRFIKYNVKYFGK